MLDRMDLLERPYIPKKPKFFFGYTGESPEKIISFKEAFIGRQKDALFFISEAIMHQKMRVGIVGENGVGKSTLIKTILKQIPLLDGYISL